MYQALSIHCNALFVILNHNILLLTSVWSKW